MGKAAIYNPYLDTLGGGEKYTLSFAKVLAEDLGYDVFFEWKDQEIKEKLARRFGFKIPSNIHFVKDIKRGEGYDICFWVSDGSIPTLRARNNLLHFQVPFQNVDGRSLLNKMKLFRINKIICNSSFTKKVIDKEYGVISEVIYPPVETKLFKAKRKENTICYVGRFSNLVQSKNHEVLIKAFKKLVSNNKFNNMKFKNWKLVLAGGVEVGVGNYINDLKKMSINYNIEIVESPSLDKLLEIYGKSKFFWSAAGYGVDQEKNPQKVEHFGLTLIEGMSAGCVPIVHNSGGFKEIIGPFNSDFLWENINDLVDKTIEMISIPGKLKSYSKLSIDRAKDFDILNFKKSVLGLKI